MNDLEKINLIIKYVYFSDDYIHKQYINACNQFLFNTSSDTSDVLELFKAKIRYEAFTDFCNDLSKILYDR